MKLDTYSLYGNKPIYLEGALYNAKLVRKLYKGWKARFYVSKDIDNSLINKLKLEGAQVIKMPHKNVNAEGMYWRFLAISDSDVEVMICRDCDSRISMREVRAVNQWLNSSKIFHIMRDHPLHKRKIMGGMWGCRKSNKFNMKDLIEDHIFEDGYIKSLNYGSDQDFLENKIYPLIKNEVFIHDEFYGGNKFPDSRFGIDFVGSIKINKNKIYHLPSHLLLLKSLFTNHLKKRSPLFLYFMILYLLIKFIVMTKKIKLIF